LVDTGQDFAVKDYLIPFLQQHGVKQLVWYEIHFDILEAIKREKQIKKWNRAWKVRLIQQQNPSWRDLYDEIV
jgi:putative endonuclease